MALFTKEAAAAASIFFSSHHTSKFHSFNKPFSLRFDISVSAPAASLKFTSHSLPLLSSSQPTKKPAFILHSASESATLEEVIEESRKPDSRRKLFVLNLPWFYSVADIKKLFGECGIVSDVEIIKQKDGKNRGFAFVTMATGEEAQAAIDKYDSYELVGRIIRVQFAKRFKKPVRPAPVVQSQGETSYKLYVSNLAWKVRSNNLRELFSPDFNPVSVKVVFDSPSGRSAGYGFVSFAIKEEAESAISALDGKELLGRPIRLKFSEKNTETSQSKEEEQKEKEESSEPQHASA